MVVGCKVAKDSEVAYPGWFGLEPVDIAQGVDRRFSNLYTDSTSFTRNAVNDGSVESKAVFAVEIDMPHSLASGLLRG